MATSEEKKCPGTDRPLFLRLRCWYHDDIGENQARNDSLAASFREKNLQYWRIENVTTSAGNVDVNDIFVPISVDFCHHSPLLRHDRAAEYTRQLWATCIEKTVLDFFDNLGKSLVVFSLYRRDEDLDPVIRAQFSWYKWQEKYTYDRASNRLGASRVKNAGQGPSTWQYLELVGKAGWYIYSLLPKTSTGAQSSQSGYTCQQNSLTANIEKKKFQLEALSDLWKAAKKLTEEHQKHQNDLTNDINVNNQRFLDTYTTFQDAYSTIITCLESVLAQDALAQTTASQTRKIQHLNAGALEELATAMREMIKIANILHDKVICLTEAVNDKHESWVKPQKWLWGGVVVALYAGGYLVFPGAPFYFWVTAGWSKFALAAGGAGGLCSGGWGSYRCHQESKARDLRKKVNDGFADVKEVLKKLFAVVAVCYCEAVLRSPFKELSKGKQDQFLDDFGIDVKEIDKIEYVDGKLQQVKEMLERSKRDFEDALTEFREKEELRSEYA